jgi:GT2 family glycosyltransferase
MSQPRVLIHIVTWNSARTIRRCIEKATSQDGFRLGEDLWVRITDNGSTDGTVEILGEYGCRRGIQVVYNNRNIGFCAAHNQGASQCVNERFAALVILNPDVGLFPDTVATMAKALDAEERQGIVTPKLLRAGAELEALTPPVLDAAGMILTANLRHFDRGSGEADHGRYNSRKEVFGATGACLMISRECAHDLLLPSTVSDVPVWRIYPELREGSESRVKLFDEGFFAYREDADLSWRAGRRGWRCMYEPAAVATHVRVVTPERRAKLPARLNALSVRNRFLLQLNNWSLATGVSTFLAGIVWRNIVVILGVLAFERSSLQGLKEAMLLAPRARAIHRATVPKREKD